LVREGGHLVVRFPVGLVDADRARECLVLGGFVDVAVDENIVATATRPTWSKPATLPKRNKSTAAAAWKLTNDAGLVDEDALIEDCGGTAIGDTLPIKGVKKACKNCTCGLKDLETGEAVVSDADLAQSVAGCGGCSKGDAFRCGSCPYLGLPTFTPGTKPAISTGKDGSKVLVLDVASEVF